MFAQQVSGRLYVNPNRTQARANRPLLDDEIRRIAPSIFAESKHESRSERYAYVSTAEVLEGMRREGFFPYMVMQGRSRIEGKEDFTKHLLRFRRESDMDAREVNEIVLVNSHDGTSSYQMMAGCYRQICSNGMLGWNTTSDIKVPHKGDVKGRIIEGAYTILDEFDNMQRGIREFARLPLNRDEKHAFAQAALALKWDPTDEEGQAPITADQVLRPRRAEDNSDNLWLVLNRAQENLIKGGVSGRNAQGRHTTTRPVRAIDTDIKLNRGLAVLAAEMAKIKGAM